MRPNVRSNYRITAVREENNSSTAQTREHYPQSRDRGDTCVDAEVLHAGAVGREEAPNMRYQRTKVTTSRDYETNEDCGQ
jgi:hypothetical protein